MYLVALCLFALQLEPSSSQFPNHLDLQKVGETIFNNEKYNILKPTTHVVSAYFLEFMLRRENADIPSTRVFIDDNGFRHYWSGFGKKTKSLRKTEILSNDIETVTDKAENGTTANKTNSINEENSTTEKANSTDTARRSNKHKASLRADTNNGTKAKKDVPENKVSKKSDGKSEGNDIKVYRHKKKDTFKSSEAFVSSDDIQLRGGDLVQPTSGKQKTVAKTTFFCPFFGVISMSAFID